jgi:hypothetical protein
MNCGKDWNLKLRNEDDRFCDRSWKPQGHVEQK